MGGHHLCRVSAGKTTVAKSQVTPDSTLQGAMEISTASKLQPFVREIQFVLDLFIVTRATPAAL